jgi:hypothetical protein
MLQFYRLQSLPNCFAIIAIWAVNQLGIDFEYLLDCWFDGGYAPFINVDEKAGPVIDARFLVVY